MWGVDRLAIACTPEVVAAASIDMCVRERTAASRAVCALLEMLDTVHDAENAQHRRRDRQSATSSTRCTQKFPFHEPMDVVAASFYALEQAVGSSIQGHDLSSDPQEVVKCTRDAIEIVRRKAFEEGYSAALHDDPTAHDSLRDPAFVHEVAVALQTLNVLIRRRVPPASV